MPVHADSVPRPDRLISAAALRRELGIGRTTFQRFVADGVIAGVTDPQSGRVRYHLPSIRDQLAVAARS